MELFETAWMDEFKYFERYYDTDLQKSKMRKIDSKTEYFVEDPKGLYEDFLDNSIKYSKKFGTAKDARDHAGICKPIYRNIRDKYIKTCN